MTNSWGKSGYAAACHAGAAIEGLCYSSGGDPTVPGSATQFYYNYTSYNSDTGEPSQPGWLTYLLTAGSNNGTVTIPTNGTKGALSLYALKSPHLPSLMGSEEFQRELAALERSLGRTIVGFPASRVGSPDGEPDPEALYHQPTDMFPNKQGSTIAEELRLWAKKHALVPQEHADDAGLALLEFEKWSVGEAVESS